MVAIRTLRWHLGPGCGLVSTFSLSGGKQAIVAFSPAGQPTPGRERMNTARLFKASCVALIVTAMSFALRGAATGSWVAQFHLTNEQAGWVNGSAFWGFTLAMMFGGPLVDALGLRRILGLAFVGHAVGILLTIMAWDFWSLFIGTLLFGIANGSVEAACHPLIATVYPHDKKTKLNHFHMWFPGGQVIGGLVSLALASQGLPWRWQFATMAVPLVIYAFMFM